MCITVLKTNFEIFSVYLSESYLFFPSTLEPPNPMFSLHAPRPMYRKEKEGVDLDLVSFTSKQSTIL